jgi:hypothetical protein
MATPIKDMKKSFFISGDGIHPLFTERDDQTILVVVEPQATTPNITVQTPEPPPSPPPTRIPIEVYEAAKTIVAYFDANRELLAQKTTPATTISLSDALGVIEAYKKNSPPNATPETKQKFIETVLSKIDKREISKFSKTGE